jgi:hypothetical protein
MWVWFGVEIKLGVVCLGRGCKGLIRQGATPLPQRKNKQSLLKQEAARRLGNVERKVLRATAKVRQ